MSFLIPTDEANALLAALGRMMDDSKLQDWQKYCVILAWVVATGSKMSDEMQDATAEVAGIIAAHMGANEERLH